MPKTKETGSAAKGSSKAARTGKAASGTTGKGSTKAAGGELSPQQREEILGTLRARFEKHVNRHKGVAWADVQARLDANPGKLWSLFEMERTGGEPDVVGHDKKNGEYLFYDCAAETPAGRRSVCFDR